MSYNLKMKILALDLGDVYIGTAISDENLIIGAPLKTVYAEDLKEFLRDILVKEKILTIVVGLPITMRGTESQQTKKIINDKELLEKEFPSASWVLWDERLTSKMAAGKGRSNSKEDKFQSHSLAAAFILNSYLTYLSTQNDNWEDF